eukprot:gene16000-17611_t
MFSALKRLTKRQDDSSSKTSPFPSGVAAIEQAMQKKFSKGVHYNMKIVIKGDRNTGKTCLFQRLQGKPFNDAYIPTQSIQAASISWNYKGHGSIVKVDVWDIVDKGQKKHKQDSLKISNESQDASNEQDAMADADFIDVYKGTHGVIMLLDITKPCSLSILSLFLVTADRAYAICQPLSHRTSMTSKRMLSIVVAVWLVSSVFAFTSFVFYHPLYNLDPVSDGASLFAALETAALIRAETKTFQYIERELPKVPNHIPVLVLANRKDMFEHQLIEAEQVSCFIEHLDRPVGSAEVNFAESSMKDGFGLQYLYRFLNIPFLILQDTREALLCCKETEEQNYEIFKEVLVSKKPYLPDAASEADETASQPSPSTSSTRSKEDTTIQASPEISSLPPLNLRQSATSFSSNISPGRNYTAKVETNIVDRRPETPEEVEVLDKSGDIHEFSPEDALDPTFLNEEKQKRSWWRRNKKQQQPQVAAEVLSTSADESDDNEDDGGNPLVAAYQDFDSDEDQPTEEIDKGNDVINDESLSDEETNANPMVLPDADISDDEYDLDKKCVDRTAVNLNQQLSIEEVEKLHVEQLGIEAKEDDNEASNSNAEKKEQFYSDNEINESSSSNKEMNEPSSFSEEKMEPINVTKDVSMHEELSDDNDDDDEFSANKYEVTAVLDEPELDDWLGNDKNDVPRDKKQDKQAQDKDNTSIEESTSNDVTVPSSFTIAADELDMFVNEQMRKSSITKVSEGEEEVKKPKKKKEKKTGDEGTKKKKKKSSKQHTPKSGEPDQERKTKKTRIKEGKKIKTSKQQVTEDYELI